MWLTSLARALDEAVIEVLCNAVTGKVWAEFGAMLCVPGASSEGQRSGLKIIHDIYHHLPIPYLYL